jgi:hypothetical protein
MGREQKEFCWIDHLNLIFYYQNSNTLNNENCENSLLQYNCLLFSKKGNLMQGVYRVENKLYEVQSVP